MELYIQIINNQPVNHPILKDNLLQAFPTIDLENNPDYVPFKRVPRPETTANVKSMTVEYRLVDGIYKDVWIIEYMNETETLT